MKLTLFTDENKNFPAFFYFDPDSITAHFYYKLSDIPIDRKQINQLTHINVKNLNEILFICIDKKHAFQLNQTNSNSTDNLSIMKSHLQKCVRRGEKTLAIETGKYMIEKGQTPELLRRLFIICLEDTILTPQLVPLTWLMIISNKNYVIPDHINAWILGFIALISELKYSDDPDFTSGKVSPKKDLMSRVKKLPQLERDLIMSLVIRISYGGMSGDLKMLNNFITKWLERFEHTHSHDMITKPLPQITTTKLDKNKMLLPAFDFHCTNIIKLIQKNTDLDENKLKELIWNHSSSINFRKANEPNDVKLWQSIEPYFISSAEYIRNKLIL
ncbi:MAG: hypothetical protein Hyperionvirus22_26 [Hyperionvirus sp.]|uniref:Uncharacterized protein n=1 Tax=Hyperionvirus sp. TaxID=2487770 RepID=A0A3G5AAS2_9VIRU|nr:MAG: hypothetical protein Hyperionvirus22_26 [Hyperionvirus sp.]